MNYAWNFLLLQIRHLVAENPSGIITSQVSGQWLDRYGETTVYLKKGLIDENDTLQLQYQNLKIDKENTLLREKLISWAIHSDSTDLAVFFTKTHFCMEQLMSVYSFFRN